VTKDFADFLESLNREGVAYVVIGGIAVLAHVPYRTTRRMPGVEWSEVWAGSVKSEFLGVPTRFAGVDELIRMKEATAGAEKDLPDIARLKRLQTKKKCESTPTSRA
jgi:hypothetical protein